MERAVRMLGLVLLVAGGATWAWVATLEGPVDRAVTPPSGTGGIGLVELELFVLDLRLGPLLLAVAGFGLLVAPSVASYSQGVLAMTAAAAAALVVPQAAAAASAWAAAAALATALAGIAMFIIRRFGAPTSPRGAAAGMGAALSLPARRLTATIALVLLCSALPMEVYLDFDAPVLAALPEGYRAAVPVLEALVLVAGMLALVLAARRFTWLHSVACLLVVAEVVALVSTGVSTSTGLALVVAAAVGATAAAVAGERGRVRHRAVLATAALALLYPAGFAVAVVGGIALDTVPLALNGGAIDYDGLPVFLAGPIFGAFPVLLYLAGTGVLASTAPPPDGFVASAEATSTAGRAWFGEDSVEDSAEPEPDSEADSLSSRTGPHRRWLGVPLAARSGRALGSRASAGGLKVVHPGLGTSGCSGRGMSGWF